MENKTEYKLSWTKKDVDGGYRKAQGDTPEEVMQNMVDLEKVISGQTPIVAEKKYIDDTEDSGCEQCGEPTTLQEGIGKNGKPYKLLKCSKDYKHNQFV